MDLPLKLHTLAYQSTGLFEEAIPLGLQRRLMDQFLSRTPGPVSVRQGEATGCPVPGRWFTPSAPGETVLLYLHGGAYVSGSVDSHQSLIGRLALACRARALAIDYRLAPEHPYPAALQDALAAYDWLRQEGVTPRQVVVMGDSAGGGLSLALMLKLRELGQPLPGAGVLICPWLDILAHGHSAAARHYAGDHDPRHPLLSPLYADLGGLSPVLVHGGEADPHHPEAAQIAQNALRDNAPFTLQSYPGCFHVWHMSAPTLAEARRAIHDISQFVAQVL